MQGVIRARCLRNILSLLRIARRIVTSVFPANVLSSLLVCRLLLSLFVPHDALLGIVLSCAMFQRPPLDPNAAARRRPGPRDGKQALAGQQQWFHLLAHCAAAIQFSLPVDWTCLCDRCKHRKQHHHCECLLQVSSPLSAT